MTTTRLKYLGWSTSILSPTKSSSKNKGKLGSVTPKFYKKFKSAFQDPIPGAHDKMRNPKVGNENRNMLFGNPVAVYEPK
jgi:hypothetical protein